jgi:hypothetical protein
MMTDSAPNFKMMLQDKQLILLEETTKIISKKFKTSMDYQEVQDNTHLVRDLLVILIITMIVHLEKFQTFK